MEQEVQVRTDVEELSIIFDKLSTYYTITGDNGRATAFSRASRLMDSYEYESITGEEAIRLKFVAGKISAIIDEYNSTGKVQRLIDFETQRGDIKSYYDFYTKYYGIGRSKAIELYNKGISTEEDMISRGNLTPLQRLGVLWYDHYSKPVRREEINLIKDHIIKDLRRFSDHYLQGAEIRIEFAGSYRRGSPYSGDIDVLIMKQPGITMNGIVEYLSDIIKVNLKQGEVIFHGIIQLAPYFYGHRIDIMLVDPDEWYTSLLHFTGSKRFNILMSQRAIEQGGQLSRKNISFHGEYIPVSSEEEIFDLLGIKYIPPRER